MKKSSVFLSLLIFLGVVFLAANPDFQSKEQRQNYLRSYRYHKSDEKPPDEFREIEVLIESIVEIYLDFASMKNRHFMKNNIELMEYCLYNTSVMQMVFILADRLVRTIAYVPALYEIDIKTGKAIDHEYILKK